MYTPPKLAERRTGSSRPSPATVKLTPVRPTSTPVACQLRLGRQKSPLGSGRPPAGRRRGSHRRRPGAAHLAEARPARCRWDAGPRCQGSSTPPAPALHHHRPGCRRTSRTRWSARPAPPWPPTTTTTTPLAMRDVATDMVQTTSPLHGRLSELSESSVEVLVGIGEREVTGFACQDGGVAGCSATADSSVVSSDVCLRADVGSYPGR